MWQQKLVQLAKTLAILGLVAAVPACADSAATSTPAAATDTAQGDVQGDTQGDSTSADSGQSDAASSDTSADTAQDSAGGVCKPSNVPCTDDQILELSLLKSVSKRTIVNTAEGNGFMSQVDATAGGFQPTESFLYARFTATGLERVDVSDQAALDSTEWDIAFRRYVVRLNSGVSGPSCVTGGVFPNKTKYEDIGAPSDSLTMEQEAYYSPSCLMVEDGSGLKAPGTVLSPYWKYASCVQMTGKVFQVELADGRKLKLAFTEFYAPEVQVTCNASGTVPQGSVGAKLRLRWAELAK